MVDFSRRALEFICNIPEGKVATYGQIAAMAGSPRAARQVGDLLRGVKDSDPDLPWQRVINAQGGLSTYKVGSGELQRALLESEGITFNDDGTVDLSRYRWQPDDEAEQLGLFN